VLSGIFARFPALKFVMTETGCSWVPDLLARLDQMIVQIRDTGATGEIRYRQGDTLALTATECFQRNVWMGVSQPGPLDVAARHVMGTDRFMWGNDYPHDEGTYPFTRENLRALFHDIDPIELQKLLAGNAAQLYDFDLAQLAPLAAQFGPTVGEISEPLVTMPDKPNDALVRASGGRR